MRAAHSELSERRACGLAGLGRSSYPYQRQATGVNRRTLFPRGRAMGGSFGVNSVDDYSRECVAAEVDTSIAGWG